MASNPRRKLQQIDMRREEGRGALDLGKPLTVARDKEDAVAPRDARSARTFRPVRRASEASMTGPARSNMRSDNVALRASFTSALRDGSDDPPE